MRLRHAALLLLSVSLFSACRDAKIASYRVPKEAPEPLPPILTGAVPSSPASAPPSAPTDMAATAVPTASGEALTWTAPANWKAKPASAMRKGSYAIPGGEAGDADLSITAFPGNVGGTLANINRWRGQIELPPLTDSEISANTTHLDPNGLHLDVVDFSNPQAAKPQRILGAMVAHNGATWFFKLMGPDSVVAREKPAFMEFLQTIKTPARATQ